MIMNVIMVIIVLFIFIIIIIIYYKYSFENDGGRWAVVVPLLHFGHSVSLPILCSDTYVSMKKNFKKLDMEKVGVGEGGLQQPPVLRGKGWQHK